MTPEEKKVEKTHLTQRVLRDHLSRQDDSLPFVTSLAGMQARGYLDENGEATQDGSQFLVLRDAGVFDDKGGLTPLGTALSLNDDEILSKHNMAHFAVANEAGLFDTPESVKREQPGIWTALTDMVGSAIKAAPRVAEAANLKNPLRKISTFEAARQLAKWAGTEDLVRDEDEADLILESVLEGGAESWMHIGSGVQGIKAKALETLGTNGAIEAKQDYLRAQREIEQFDAARVVVAATDSMDAVEHLAAVEERIGPERTEEVLEGTEEFGNIFADPAGLVPVTKSFQVARLPHIARRAKRLVEAAQKLKVDEAAQRALSGTAKSQAEWAARAEKMAENANDMGRSSKRLTDYAEKLRGRSAQSELIARKMADGIADQRALVEKLSKQPGVVDGASAISTKLRTSAAKGVEGLGKRVEDAGNWIARKNEDFQDFLKARNLENLGPAAAAISGVGGVTMNPLLAAPLGVIAMAPVMRSTGNFLRLAGKEAQQYKGSVPYWRRVGHSESLGPMFRSMVGMADELRLSQAGTTAGRIGRGLAEAYPYDLAFEVLASGGEVNLETLQQAAAETLIFGGGGATLGAITLGKKNRLNEMQAGDEMNFRAELKPSETAIYDQLPKSERRTIATVSAINPTLNVKMTTEGPSSYAADTNTMTVNVNDPSRVRPLVHHELEHYLVTRNQMDEAVKAMMIGTEGEGGLLRDSDGNLSSEFTDFQDEMNRRRAIDGLAPLDTPDASLEFFIENAVDDMVSADTTGQMVEDAQRTRTSRAMRGLISEWIGKSAFLRDFFLNTGGAYDKTGKPVMGNGILAEGMRELPEVKNLSRKIRRDAFGMRYTPEPTTVKGRQAKEDSGSTLTAAEGDHALAESAVRSMIKEGPDGKPLRDEKGNLQYIDRKEDNLRKSAGLTAREVQADRQARGEKMKEGEIRIEEDGTQSGRFLSPEAVKRVANDGILSKHAVSLLRRLNAAIKKNTGTPFMVINNPATTKRGAKWNYAGKVNYASLPATFRKVVPMGIEITKTGQFLVRLMSITKLDENIRARAATKRGRDLYQGNSEAIKVDVQEYLELHKQGLETDGFFKEKYGSQWRSYKDFVNSLFGLLNKEQRAINPVFDSDKVGHRDAVIRTYRLDRLSKATQLEGEARLPTDVGLLKLNYFPNGIDAFHGTPHKVDQFSTDYIGTGEGAQAYGWGLYFAGDEMVAGDYARVLGRNRHGAKVDGKSVTGQIGEFTSGTKASILYEIQHLHGGDVDGFIKSNTDHWNAKIKDAPKGSDHREAYAEFRDDINAVAELARGKIIDSNKGGNLYKVSLKPKAEEFLDWDNAPISTRDPSDLESGPIPDDLAVELLGWEGIETEDQFFDAITEAEGEFAPGSETSLIGQVMADPEPFSKDKRDWWASAYVNAAATGEWVYQALSSGEWTSNSDRFAGSGKEASQILRDIGIKGIRFLDGKSRREGEGSYNYVIFDGADVEILEENGKPVRGEKKSEILDDYKMQPDPDAP